MCESTNATAVANVKNVPYYAMEKKYWVVSAVNNELWFYGAWDDKDDVTCVAALEPDFRILVENTNM